MLFVPGECLSDNRATVCSKFAERYVEEGRKTEKENLCGNLPFFWKFLSFLNRTLTLQSGTPLKPGYQSHYVMVDGQGMATTELALGYDEIVINQDTQVCELRKHLLIFSGASGLRTSCRPCIITAYREKTKGGKQVVDFQLNF